MNRRKGDWDLETTTRVQTALAERARSGERDMYRECERYGCSAEAEWRDDESGEWFCDEHAGRDDADVLEKRRGLGEDYARDAARGVP